MGPRRVRGSHESGVSVSSENEKACALKKRMVWWRGAWWIGCLRSVVRVATRAV